MYLKQKNVGKHHKQLTQTSVKCGIDQDCFDKMVIRYIVNGIQPLRTVEDDSFKELVLGKQLNFLSVKSFQ